jgi:putative transcriptional regulator
VKNRLRVLRAELDWSQAELAERLGVSRQTVNAIETGKYDPSLPLAFSIARTFKRRIEEIFEAELTSVPKRGHQIHRLPIARTLNVRTRQA